ncbi:MAG: hypothetical protein GX640_21955 [Fibrobacter sp.]|nr:hypothetical protein [Fibrobacter sp.]
MKTKDNHNSSFKHVGETGQQFVKPDIEDEISKMKEIRFNDISAIDLILILWKNKFVLFVCMFLTTVVGLIYALTATESFTTSCCFIVKTSSKGGGNLNQLAALAGVNIFNSSNTDPSDYLDKVIQDKNFIEKLLERKWFFKNDSLTIENILKIKLDTTLKNWEYTYFMTKVEKVRKCKLISIRKDAKTGLLHLSSVAPDPQLAYDLNVFTLDYISDYIRNSIKTQAKEKRVFIDERIIESKQALEKSEDVLARFRGSNLMTSSPQVMLEEARLLRQVTMNQEIYIQFQKQYELARIEELDNQTLVQVVKGAEVPIERFKPQRKNVIFLSLILGFMLGSVICYGHFIFNKSL